MPFPNFPAAEDVLQMEPEELAPFILRYLTTQQSINRYNFKSPHDGELSRTLGNRYNDYVKRLMEAWMWLEREGFVAPQPGQQNDWAFVTRNGQRVLDSENFQAYTESSLFPSQIDPVLTRNVKPLFVRGDYDTAVFRAFKEVEVRVREKSALTNDDYGIDLMKRAFGTGGALENTDLTKGERDRVRDLFVGSIGTFKNPSGHRNVPFDNPREVIDIISLANQLLRMVDRIS